MRSVCLCVGDWCTCGQEADNFVGMRAGKRMEGQIERCMRTGIQADRQAGRQLEVQKDDAQMYGQSDGSTGQREREREI